MIRNRLFTVILVLSGFFPLFGELPPDLPGEEISQEYLKFTIPKDTTTKGPSKEELKKENSLWYNKIAKTWDAPPLAEQMASDKINVPLGKGGVYFPRFTEAEYEPDIEIIDPNGVTQGTGGPGETYSLEPGTYYVMFGSGSHRQRMVRTVEVVESKITPVMPDWAGLTIETVDTNSNYFRGEYELVRIDEFEPYGRGFGADQEIGEAVNTWVLKPGTYKILGRGENYNTLRNFVTVRLLPGELVKFLLVQKPENMVIVSGGTIDITPGKKITSHWKYGANIGGMLQFNAENDRREEHGVTITSILSLSTTLWLNFNKNSYEWGTMVRMDEGFSISELDFSNLTTGVDDFRINSLYIWRFLSWLGPYGRTEMRTNLLPRRVRPEDFKKQDFCILEKDSTIDSSSFDPSRKTFEISPSFSPFTFDIGGGANFDAVNTRIFEAKIRLGAGSSFSSFPSRYQSVDAAIAQNVSSDDSLRLKSSIVLIHENETRLFEFGPQGSVSGNLRIGRLGTASAELKIFAPVVPEMRFTRPDFDLSATLSWRLARAITLDYDYAFQLKQPDDPDAQVEKSTHRIWLRFSYSSR